MSDAAIQRVAAIGARTTGARCAAAFLADGPQAAARDSAPGAEAFLEKFIPGERLAAGIAEEAAHRDITQLEARDQFLVDLLAMRAKGKDG
jgi:hypothetical protein